MTYRIKQVGAYYVVVTGVGVDEVVVSGRFNGYTKARDYLKWRVDFEARNNNIIQR